MSPVLYDIPDPISVEIPESTLTRIPGITVLSGTIWQVSFYTGEPTFSFLDYKSGGCYFDLILQDINGEMYPIDNVTYISMYKEIPLGFKPPLQYVQIFNKDRTLKGIGSTTLGLIWPRSNEALFVVQQIAESCDETDKLLLWPVHKLLFKQTYSALKDKNVLPNWQKNPY